MPKVPDYGNKKPMTIFLSGGNKKQGTKTTDQYQESKTKGGGTVKIKSPYKPEPIVSNLPHPLKCSRCDYIATDSRDSKQHWFDSH